MGLLSHKKDPTTEYGRALNAEIAALEEQIQQLQQELEKPKPRLRSTAVPNAPPAPKAVPPATPANHDPIFEPVDRQRLKTDLDHATPEHFNDLGVRKYDLLSAWQRVANHFRGPTASNPKLVQFLAAGSIQGLRPLRYEKRVARNRLIVLIGLLLLALWGLCAFLMRNR